MPGRKRLFNDKEKWCSRCKAWLVLDAFGDKLSSRSPCKKEAYCRKCKSEYDQAQAADHPEYKERQTERQRWYARFSRLKAGTVLPSSTEEFRILLLKMLEDQDHKCAICREPIAFNGQQCHVDHDHVTGVIRGLLCGRCNRGLGHFRDSMKLLQQAIEYLRKATSA